MVKKKMVQKRFNEINITLHSQQKKIGLSPLSFIFKFGQIQIIHLLCYYYKQIFTTFSPQMFEFIYTHNMPCVVVSRHNIRIIRCCL